jgi:hypothetical protein
MELVLSAQRLALPRRETRPPSTRAGRSITAALLLTSLTAASLVPPHTTELHTAHWALSDTSCAAVLRLRRPMMADP